MLHTFLIYDLKTVSFYEVPLRITPLNLKQSLQVSKLILKQTG